MSSAFLLCSVIPRWCMKILIKFNLKSWRCFIQDRYSYVYSGPPVLILNNCTECWRFLYIVGRANPSLRCVLMEMNRVGQACSCVPVQTFTAGASSKMLTKNSIFKNPGNDNSMLVCAGDEASQSTMVRHLLLLSHHILYVCTLPLISSSLKCSFPVVLTLLSYQACHIKTMYCSYRVQHWSRYHFTLKYNYYCL